MKKFLKVLAATAAVAAVIPFRGEGDKHSGEVAGLLWKATWKIDPEHKTQSDINVTIGFNNPFEAFKKESHLFADDLVVDYCGEGGIAPNTVMYCDETCECEGETECKCEAECECENTESAEPVESTADKVKDMFPCDEE